MGLGKVDKRRWQAVRIMVRKLNDGEEKTDYPRFLFTYTYGASVEIIELIKDNEKWREI